MERGAGLGVQMGCRTPLRGVTPERRASLHLGRHSWGSDSRGPHLHPRPELENIRPLLPGRLCSPEETSPRTPAETPRGTAYSLLVWVWDRQTDRDIRLQAVWLLVEGQEERKCICRDGDGGPEAEAGPREKGPASGGASSSG